MIKLSFQKKSLNIHCNNNERNYITKMDKVENSGKAHYSKNNGNVIIEEKKEEAYDERCYPQLKRLPKQTWTVLTAELCERFSYYGIKTVLVLYLYMISTSQNESDKKANATAIYHAFSMVSYFTGVVGAMVADSFLGKYRTILWSFTLYCGGEIVLTLTTIPSLGGGSNIGPLIGLFVTAIACGNIKPCMAAFGGDQLPQKDTGLIKKFFALFYMSVNVGAMLTMIFVPMMRTNIRCFGDNCYTVVFGVNCIVILLATGAICVGSKWYVKKEPEGNMMIRVFHIIFHALGNKRQAKKGGNKSDRHWLYYAQDKYEKSEIEDVRALLKVLSMFLPLPVFWALFSQQGSSWTLQARQMNGDLGHGQSLRSDQIQFFNPVLVLVLIPLFDTVIYPCLQRCNIKLSPLKRMTCGMILAAISFAVTGFIQIKIQDVQPLPTAPPYGQTSIDFINVSPCERIEIIPDSYFKLVVQYGMHSTHQLGQSGNRSFVFRGINCYSNSDRYETTVKLYLKETKRQSIFIDINMADNMEAKIIDHDFPDVSVITANTRVRTIYTDYLGVNGNVSVIYDHTIENDLKQTFNHIKPYDAKYRQILAEDYRLMLKSLDTNGLPQKNYISGNKIKLGTFGASTVLITRLRSQKISKNSEHVLQLQAHLFEDVKSTSVHRIWQLPQYIIITAGEVMFSVTGLEFAYSQAPSSMKSVLQACWLLTVAFGDLIVVILSIAKPVEGVEKEMFLYGAVMLIVAFLFAIMSYFYTYSDFSGKVTNEVVPMDEKNVDESTEMESEIGNIKEADSTTHL